MNYETALISKLITEERMKDAIDWGINEELFTSCKDEWNYITEFYRTHGSSPPPEKFTVMYPEFDLSVNTAPLSFLVDELRQRRMFNLTSRAMKEAASELKSKRPARAVEIFRQLILETEIQTRPARDVNLVDNPLERLKEYDAVVASGGITGLPSPWPLLDEATMGFHSEELWMVVARGGIGKTWCEVIGARFHWLQGYTPLLFTKEMAVNQIAKRFDATHAMVAHKRLRAGQLTHEEYNRYVETLRNLEGARPFWVSGDDDAAGGVSGIRAKIDRYKPNVVWIDGMYLVEDERRAQSGWERMKNIAGDLKSCARQTGIPIIVSHQFNQEGKEDKGNADTLAYGDIQKWFDGILGMYQTEDLRLNREMLFKLLKHREGERCEFVSTWDLDSMTFDQKEFGLDDVGTGEISEEDEIQF